MGVSQSVGIGAQNNSNNYSNLNQSHLLYDQFLPGDEVRIIEVVPNSMSSAIGENAALGNSTIAGTKKISEQIYRVNSVVVDDQAEFDKYSSRDASNYMQQSKGSKRDRSGIRRAIVVEYMDNSGRVVGVFQPEQLININNDKNKRRRIEWKLLHNYVQSCNAKKVAPNEMVISIYSEHIKQGVPVFKLDLPGSNLQDNDIFPLVELFKGDSAIRKLDLSDNCFTDISCQSLCSTLRQHDLIRELDLSDNNLGFKGASHVGKLIESSTSLVSLNLCSTRLGAAGCDLIIDGLIKSNPASCSLARLDLRKNNVSDRQVSMLLRAARQVRSLCIVELYPPNDNEAYDIDKSNDAHAVNAWLSYEGWTDYGNLHSVLLQNKEYVEGNPDTLIKSKGPVIKSAEDAFEYLLYRLVTVKDALLEPTTCSTASNSVETPQEQVKLILEDASSVDTPTRMQQENLVEQSLSESTSVKTSQQQQQAKHKQTFEEWKKTRQIAYEWRQLTKDQAKLLDMETQLKREHSKGIKLEANAALSDNLVVGVTGDLLGAQEEQQQELPPLPQTLETSQLVKSQVMNKSKEEEEEEDWIVLDDEFGDIEEKTRQNKKTTTTTMQQQQSMSSSSIFLPSASVSSQSMVKTASKNNSGSHAHAPSPTPLEALHRENDARTVSSIISAIKSTNGQSSSSVLSSSSVTPMMNCSICMETKPSSEFYILDECYHKFCTECLRNYIAIKINNFEADLITCPQCNVFISPSQIKQLIHMKKQQAGDHKNNKASEDDDLFTKFENYTLKKALLNMKNLVWCPNHNCCNAMVVDNRISCSLPINNNNGGAEGGEAQPQQHVLKVVCSACGTKICGMCKNEYHPEVQSCIEFAMLKKKQQELEHAKNEELNKQYFSENMIKNCPNCKISIQKMKHTCNEVKCKNCNTVFCFYCGEAFTNANEHYKSKKCSRYNMLHDLNPFVE